MALDASSLKQIRVLIPDNEAIYGDAEDQYLFADDELEAYYEVGFSNVLCAAGLAKMAIGASEAFLLKVIKNYESSTNGAALMREWEAAGQKLYDRGLDQIAMADDAEGIFEIAFPEFDYDRHPEGYSHGSYEIGPWV